MSWEVHAHFMVSFAAGSSAVAHDISIAVLSFEYNGTGISGAASASGATKSWYVATDIKDSRGLEAFNKLRSSRVKLLIPGKSKIDPVFVSR
jgi:hypothetical protein